MQIVILDAGLQMYYVWVLTLCVRAYQAQPEGNAKHQAPWEKMSTQSEENQTR